MEFRPAAKYGMMKLTYERLHKIATDNGSNIDLADARVATETFFNHCYHFKDWLKRAFPDRGAAVERFITKSPALSLAADYCNTFKHAGLDSTPRSGAPIDKVLTHTRIAATPSGFAMSSDLDILIGGKKHKASELAKKCMEEWESFLKDQRISLTP
jgi:hypothetical protein